MLLAFTFIKYITSAHWEYSGRAASKVSSLTYHILVYIYLVIDDPKACVL